MLNVGFFKSLSKRLVCTLHPNFSCLHDFFLQNSPWDTIKCAWGLLPEGYMGPVSSLTIGLVGVTSQNFHTTCCKAGVIIWYIVTTFGGPTPRMWEDKNLQNLTQFLTIFNFDRNYFRNGST